MPIVYGIVVALLFQSHVLMAGLALGCIIEMFFNKEFYKIRNIIGISIPTISLVFMVFELKQNDKTETFIHINLNYILNRINYENFKQSFLHLHKRKIVIDEM